MTQPLRLLHIIASADPRSGGPVEALLRIGDVLQSQGHRQELLTLDNPNADFLTDFPRTVYALGNARKSGGGLLAKAHRWHRYSPNALTWLREHIADYDGVIVNGLWNYAAHISRRVLPNSGVPYIVYPHGMLDPWFRRRYPLKHIAKQILWPLNEGALLKHAQAVCFTSAGEANQARDSFRPYYIKETVMAYGTAQPPQEHPSQQQAFADAVPELGERPYILFLGRVHEKKGCDMLVSAFASIANRSQQLDLVIAGPGDTIYISGLKKQIKSLGLCGRVHWAGMVSGNAKWGAFRRARAFILPSHQENFGIAVAEALACGCPVLVSDKVNIVDAIVSDGAGLSAPDTLDGTLSLLTSFAAMNERQRLVMSAAAASCFTRRFTAERAAADLLAALKH